MKPAKQGFRKIPVGVFCAEIVHVELRWCNFAPRLCLYLKIDDPILGFNKKPVPLDDSHGAGGFKNEVKSIQRFKMSHPDLVRLRLKETAFIHPFILNNELYGFGFTNQWKYYQHFLNFIRENLNLDARLIDESNVKDWEEVLAACLVGQTFESGWAQWFHPSKTPYVGPDGDEVGVVQKAA